MKENKTSLERSHSTSSNFKLTILALFSALSMAGIWLSLAFLKYFSNSFVPIFMSVGFFVLTILLIQLFNKFTR